MPYQEYHDKNGKEIIVTDLKPLPIKQISHAIDNQTVHMEIATSSNLIAYMIVDLSDTTNWKHINTAQIVLDFIMIEVNPGTNFTGEIKIGYLKNVDADNGDFCAILDIDLTNKSEIYRENINFQSTGFHLHDSSHFGPIIVDSTLFQTDVDLGGPDDPTTPTYPSGDGDFVLIVDQVSTGTNAVAVDLTIGYETLDTI